MPKDNLTPLQTKIETQLELDGAQCEQVVIYTSTLEYDKAELKAMLPAYVKFERGYAYYEGRLDAEAALAIYLILTKENE